MTAVRVVVYTDYVYRRHAGVHYGERAFALFVGAIADQVEVLKVVGRLSSETGPTRYALPPEVRFDALPHYDSLAHPRAVLSSLVRSLARMWKAVDDVDVAWILGPYPHAIALVTIALLRRRAVVLGVRQDWPVYVRMRRPGRRWLHRAADLLEWIWQTLGRRLPVVAVGPELASKYSRSPVVMELAVSVLPSAVAQAEPPPRRYDGPLTVLSVGRLEPEKNPLLLADVLAALHRRERRWRLTVCGEGQLSDELARRLASYGLGSHSELLGYVPMGESLLDVYRHSHALLHVSWTEGFPQVLVEAFATRLPVVATAVGGVPSGVGGAALLVAPGDADAAAAALIRIASEPSLRDRLVAQGYERARHLTVEVQTRRLVEFLHANSDRNRGRLPVR